MMLVKDQLLSLGVKRSLQGKTYVVTMGLAAGGLSRARAGVLGLGLIVVVIVSGRAGIAGSLADVTLAVPLEVAYVSLSQRTGSHHQER